MTYKLDLPALLLVPVPEMEKPDKEKYYGREHSTDVDAYDLERYYRDLNKYQQYTATFNATPIPLSSVLPHWEDGMVLREEDFDVEYEVKHFDTWGAIVNKQVYDKHKDTHRRMIAHPIDKTKDGNSEQQKQEGEAPTSGEELEMRIENYCDMIAGPGARPENADRWHELFKAVEFGLSLSPATPLSEQGDVEEVWQQFYLDFKNCARWAEPTLVELKSKYTITKK